MTFRSYDLIMILDLYLIVHKLPRKLLYMDIPIKYHTRLAYYMVEDI